MPRKPRVKSLDQRIKEALDKNDAKIRAKYDNPSLCSDCGTDHKKERKSSKGITADDRRFTKDFLGMVEFVFAPKPD